MEINRRDFLKVCAAAAGQTLVTGCAGTGEIMMRKSESKTMPRRVLGRTGREVSIIGLGGIVVMNADPKAAAKVVAEAVANGIDYFDVAPSYGDAELKLGPALRPYRDRVFLACKSVHRDRVNIAKEMDASFTRLETDHFDLYQLHAIADVEKDVRAVFARGGAMEAILEARRQGRIRHIGFSAHTPQAALAAMKEFDFDTMMYPVNFCTHYRSGFEVEPLAEAKKRNVGVIAIKATARQKWPPGADHGAITKCWYQPLTDPAQARLGLYWTLSQNVTVAIPPGEEMLFRRAMEDGPGYRRLNREELAYLRGLAEGLDPIFSPTAPKA